MSIGVPTIASKGSSIHEFAKDGALLVNTEYIDEISSAMNDLINDAELYNEISRKAKLLSRQYTWAATARLTINEYYST